MAEKTAEQKKNDWALKVLAVVFAVILWFYADAEQNPMTGRQFDVPVQYINQAEDYVVADGVSTVRVTIRGKEADLTSLRSDDFTATVDLTNAVAGSGEYDITVEAPSVTEKFSYLPVKTMLTIDQMQTKDVSVRVRTTGSLPSGYELSSTDVVPELVTVAGLSKDLDAISNIETEVIDISGMTEETIREVKLRAPEGINISGEQRVAVHFLVQEQQAHSNYTANITLLHVPEGVRINASQQTASVLLSGSNKLLQDQNELNKIQLYVDCSGLDYGQHQLPVQVKYEGSLQVAQINPSAVTVTVEALDNSDTAGPDSNEENETNNTTNHEGDLN